MSGPATEALARAAEAARLAPSIHNTQPWRWVVRGDQLELHAVAARQLLEQDPEGRLMRLSCGAALHHARVALGAEGWVHHVERSGGEPRVEPRSRGCTCTSPPATGVCARSCG